MRSICANLVKIPDNHQIADRFLGGDFYPAVVIFGSPADYEQTAVGHLGDQREECLALCVIDDEDDLAEAEGAVERGGNIAQGGEGGRICDKVGKTCETTTSSRGFANWPASGSCMDHRRRLLCRNQPHDCTPNIGKAQRRALTAFDRYRLGVTERRAKPVITGNSAAASAGAGARLGSLTWTWLRRGTRPARRAGTVAKSPLRMHRAEIEDQCDGRMIDRLHKGVGFLQRVQEIGPICDRVGFDADPCSGCRSSVAKAAKYGGSFGERILHRQAVRHAALHRSAKYQVRKSQSVRQA